MPSIPEMWKAVVGALMAGLGSLYQALDNGGVTAQEWVAVAIAAVGAFAVVFGVPNAESQKRDAKGRFVGNESGVTLSEVCLTVIAVIFVLWAFGVVPTK